MFELKNIITDHPFSIQEVESLYPFERDIYISLNEKYMKDKLEEMKKNRSK